MLQLFKKIQKNLIPVEELITSLPNERGIRLYELQWISTLVKEFKPKTILELGTMYGRTTINLAKFSPEDCKIFTIDKNEVKTLHILKQYPFFSKIQFCKSNTLTFDFKKLPQIDFAFIDANYTYKYVIKDTLNVLKILSPTGVIIWHDYKTTEKIQVKNVIDNLGLKVYQIPKTSLAIRSVLLFNEYWKLRYHKLGVFKTVGNRSWNFEEYKQKTLQIQSQIAPFLERGEKVLDFGCGIGRFKPLLTKFYKHYYGADIIKQINSNFVQINGSVIPLSEKVDGIFTAFTLQHIVDEYLLREYFKQFNSLLKDNGYLYIYEEIGKGEISNHYGYDYLKLRNKIDYIKLCKYIGTIEVCKQFNQYLFLKVKK